MLCFCDLMGLSWSTTRNVSCIFRKDASLAQKNLVTLINSPKPTHDTNAHVRSTVQQAEQPQGHSPSTGTRLMVTAMHLRGANRVFDE